VPTTPANQSAYCQVDAKRDPLVEFSVIHAPSAMDALKDAPGSNDAAIVWTGSRMIVWSGDHIGNFGCPGSASGVRKGGGLYDPMTQSWEQIPLEGAPQGRHMPAAVWTGSQFIVWGGFGAAIGVLADGGIFTPETMAWSAMNSEGAPATSCNSTVVWTGSQMLLWFSDGDGWAYSVNNDSWAALPRATSPLRLRGLGHAAVWTGLELLAFNEEGSGDDCSTDAAAWDPQSEQWRTLSSAPSCLGSRAAAHWLGDQVLLWSPQGGALYDPCLDHWQPLANAALPKAPLHVGSRWVGGQLIVAALFEDEVEITHASADYRYDPSTDTLHPKESGTDWSAFSPGVWTGTDWLTPRGEL
jgi:hypothetical protein